jgi:thiamine-phosphate pyrophosphorylase
MMQTDYLKLCLVTNFAVENFFAYQQFITEIAQAGVTCVQLRAKHASDTQLHHFATTLKTILQPYGIPLIINDNVNIAKAVAADGVHIGQGDMSPQTARDILGPDKIIGWSVETLADLNNANQLNCIDYIGASAVFTSTTKLDCKTIWGIDGLTTLTAQSKHPVVGIGGINSTNIESVIASGAAGAAVISAIHQHPQPAIITADLLNKINQTLSRQTHV